MEHLNESNKLSGEEARSELYALLHRGLYRKQAIERVVEIGAKYLNLDHGHITSIDEDENRWEIIGSTDSPDGPYPDGLTAKLSDSYCRRTFQQSTPLALHDAGNQGWKDDHAYQLHQLDTYLGIRIDVFGEPYGTICFVESDGRNKPFSEAEQIFIEVAAQILRKVLEDTQYEKDLANRDRLISVLNRVLRHNLRNDLNVVHGNAQLLLEQTSGSEATLASTIESKTTELISLAESARKLENLTKSIPVSRPVDIVPMVERTVSEICDENPSVTCSLSTPEQAISFAAPQFSDAISELLENAAKHAGPEPSIDVTVHRGSDQITVQIKDDGPGLPSGERRILSGESEQPLRHGSGLGLALVYWIITNLDAEIDVTTTASGTTVEMHLQRAGSVPPQVN
ncbi:MAG: GAF domain-containing sensor histidine kinase [Halobacteriota archaeon]